MQSTQPSPERIAPRRFRAATIDEALEAARRELGPDIELVEANRIRRGGVGGFFATELGVEIVVEVPHPVPAAVAAGKPHFYDRVVEEEFAAPSGLDRLIENAARAERVAHHDVVTAATPADDRPALDRPAPDLGSFAEHFAREMSEHVPPAPAEVSQPVAAPPLRHDLDEMTELPRARRLTPEAAEPAVERPVERPVERAARARRSDRKAPTAAKRDPLRRPSELAAAAASRLIADLADVVARDGSRVEDLARLRVSITTPDGAVIELTAEMDGRDRA